MTEEATDVAINQGGPLRGRRLKQKALKNKALAVSFNEKDLKDYVTGFHKRKKKRRKEANKQVEEAERRKRIERRKKRKMERELVSGVAPSEDGSAPEEGGLLIEEDEDEAVAPISGTKTYNSGDMKVIVTTSEISREESSQTANVPTLIARPAGHEKNSVPVSKKKVVFKRTARKKPLQRKRDKRKGKEKRKPPR